MLRVLKMDARGVEGLVRRYEPVGLKFTPEKGTVLSEGEGGVGIGVSYKLAPGKQRVQLGLIENTARGGRILFITSSNASFYIGQVRCPQWVGAGTTISLEVEVDVEGEDLVDASHLVNVHVLDTLP